MYVSRKGPNRYSWDALTYDEVSHLVQYRYGPIFDYYRVSHLKNAVY